MSPEPRQSSLLERTYAELDLAAGTLLEPTATPSGHADDQQWSELGDWLLLAERVKAERVFFVNNDPVLVFSSLPEGADEKDVLDRYRRTWSLARPRCLFLAVGNELRVYALTVPPAMPGSDQKPLTPIQVITRAADVGDALASYHRERLESGAAFEDTQFAAQSGRADQQLLRDVSAATTALVEAGLTARVAHTLIERAILVRYLEDREVLTAAYFDTVASHHSQTVRINEEQDQVLNFGQQSHFIQFLNDKRLAYALFEQLASDFNGDLFVPETGEQEVVTIEHLRLLRSLLQGTAGTQQKPLFLWAYDFSVIPTNLVSTMYEMFYRDEADENTSTYYTPPELIEFVLADVLSSGVLDHRPKICDPACGSGTFLVEAYRRIVRHETAREGKPLSSDRLRDLLLNRIAGCDIDESAIRLAAFSLYVAFLNYQSPQDIRRAGPLPRLIHRAGQDSHEAPLVVADAFSLLDGESDLNMVRGTDQNPGLPWRAHSFDVVVGNPPWTEPPRGVQSYAEQWATQRHLAFGDRSQSQLFLWRALDLLTDGGVAALLVSAKTMFNTRTTSKAFRTQWLQNARVEHVVNFSKVRRDFFKQSVAPFMLLRFRRADDKADGMLIYETAQHVASGRRGSSALVRLERRVVSQASLQNRDHLWKTYSAGSLRDEAFLSRLELEDRLRDWILTEPKSQYGFQRSRQDERAGHSPSLTLRSLRSLAKFQSWGPLREEWFESVPSYIKFVPDEGLFRGQRLLVRRGVSTGFGPHARLETEPFAFRHTTYGMSLDHLPEWQAKVMLGTLLSSLGRYWLYMVSGSWGTWRDEVRSQDILDLPVRLPETFDSTTEEIVQAVDSLKSVRSSTAHSLWTQNHVATDSISTVLGRIDNGIADLFGLTTAERDLIGDFWAGLGDHGSKSVLIDENMGGTVAEINSAQQKGIGRYLETFLTVWNRHLGSTGELSWRVWRDPRSHVIAVVFETRLIDGEVKNQQSDEEQDGWLRVLERLGVQLERRQSQSILTYGLVRVVTDTAIVIVKRDEQRLWTATAAREDADATTAQVMALERR